MKDLVSNRKAFYDYEIGETFEAGIVLVGTEIKSLRDHGGSLQDAWVREVGGELTLMNMSIAPYRFGNVHNHEDRRPRKLLMHKKEIAYLSRAVREKSMALIPIAVYLSKNKAKVKLALAKGKKAHDKRQAIRERDDKKHMDRAMKNAL